VQVRKIQPEKICSRQNAGNGPRVFLQYSLGNPVNDWGFDYHFNKEMASFSKMSVSL
jgi:hypothetical protein